MTTALYRRYRPEAFGEMIGQSQVTEPLMTALRGDRVGHAYLFSGPRGCGKTTSARILARCLNCAQGPTDTPCGECESCIELGRGGGGSLDVVEIDAASHNGVDDARDLRERAVFAPARDRFKIFILDEAHMVTPQGFNALLKLVEEPPDHVKFIFATTEPEKVIGTIRSRTHHYPFRLVPPAAMLEYVGSLCESEGVVVDPGVLPLVVRAGGGSPRDTLSLLDQLIAGSEGAVTYERAVALLGYTHAELLDEIVDALATSDAGAVFAAVDRVVQTGQDPRRFVDDLLERLRDLIVVAATGDGAAAVLRGASPEDLQRMAAQADRFGAQRLSRSADVVVAALDEMTGATSPRLQLELMCARVLALEPAAPVASGAPVAVAAPASAATAAATTPGPAAATTPAPTPPAAAPAPAAVSTPAPAPEASAPAAEPVPEPPTEPVTLDLVRERWAAVLAALEGISRSSWLLVSVATVADFSGDVLTLTFANASDVAKFKHLLAGAGPSEDLRTAIKRVLGIRVKYLAKHDPASGAPGSADPSDDGPGGGSGPAGPPPAPQSRGGAAAGSGSADAQPRGSADAQPRGSAGTQPRGSAGTQPRGGTTAASAAPAVTDWAVAPIPSSEAPTAVLAPSLAVDDEPEDAPAGFGAHLPTPREGEVITADEPPADDDDAEPMDLDVAPDQAPVIAQRIARAPDGAQRYGEAVVRQLLGARFIREEPHASATRFG
ncbi:DNA polymerase III subunit gamma and tau [Microbacterium schleiferi]|uniref:DNA polymerase III subunit gamma/tau n=1 Tax=Microbacterium schleiferi TaxID=69362 RepID=A0A7S8RGX4_9MICO|nr:DNA polymerase III subunit gamma and tau [Microbacterium schleiferi]QPE04012.1 DNA polymerase III subunit gamma and tau [Microbacterium schleiferi]